ncbi:nitroreductase [Amycolatopsis sp. FU40]|uniref:nitroreductase family protein n=1 Tax=Amycolatopsis sp. FU40 TaxID=2914159 RepID=UPI001F321C3B|nr:nitroreductase [Amycolatopsis sp. FU40]UKD58024.1 nitroreductase [Amycolatopsis sp. FU40]
MLTTVEAINARCSTPRLAEPGPTGAELRSLFRAAAAAPDHGKCKPWRFVVVPPAYADDFGEVLEQAYVRRCALAGDDVDAERCARERTRLRRAPTFVVVVCQPRTDLKIPLHEQQAAVAAATQNLLLAATSMGYGSMWATGAAATDPTVREALQLGPKDTIVGFVYLGSLPTSRERRGPRRDTDVSAVVRTWAPAPKGRPDPAPATASKARSDRRMSGI